MLSQKQTNKPTNKCLALALPKQLKKKNTHLIQMVKVTRISHFSSHSLHETFPDFSPL